MTFGAYPGDEAMTAEEARAEAEVLRGDTRRGDPARDAAAKQAKGMTVAALCDEYLVAVDKGLVHGKRGRPKSPLTIATDKGRINGHIKPLLGTKLVKVVTRQDVKRFLEAVQVGKSRRPKGKRKRGTPFSGGPGAAARVVGLLGGIFTYAVDRGYRDDNPASRVKRPSDQRRTAFMTMDDYRSLGAALSTAEGKGEDARVVGAIRALALTGCRRGEVVGLRLPEIDLDARPLRLASTKEGYSLRPLGEAAAKELRRLVEKLDRPEGSDAVFVGKEGKAFSGLQRGWERIAKWAKLDEGITLHTLRHSFATTANTLGYSEATIAAMLGHSRGTVTSRYVHVVDDALLAAADRVSGAIARAMAGEKDATVTRIGTRLEPSARP
jgi:integrase